MKIFIDKIVFLSITLEEREKLEKEYSLASKVSIEDEEMSSVEAFSRRAKDHYKHLLVHRGCYKIVELNSREQLYSNSKVNQCF